MEIIYSHFISQKEYKEEINEFDESEFSIYHSLEWLEAISKGMKIKIFFAKCSSDKGKTLAILPVMLKSNIFFRIIGTPLSGGFTEYIGPIIRKNIPIETHCKIISSLERLISKNSSYVEWGSKGDASWAECLSLNKYKNTKRHTLVINLCKSKDEIWKTFQSRARNMIRKAKKNEVLTKTIQPNKDWIINFYNMLANTFSSQNMAVPHPLSFYEELTKLSTIKKVLFIEAKHRNNFISGGIFLIDRERMVFLSGASNELGMKLAGSSILQWHAIKEAIKLGIMEYDMGGIGINTIDKFKKSFGGQEYSYNRWIYRTKMFSFVEPVARFGFRLGLIKLG